MTTKEILQEAHSYIEKGWTQKAYARDAGGKPVDAKDPDACSWCAVGALQVANSEQGRLVELWRFLDSFIDQPLSSGFNDHPETTQDDVLNLFEKAIACSE